MSTRRSFLKGLAAAAALTLSRLLPDLAPENEWGFRGPHGIDDYKIVFEYVPMIDGFGPYPPRRLEIPASVLREMADGGDAFAARIIEKHGRITRVVSNAEWSLR